MASEVGRSWHSASLLCIFKSMWLKPFRVCSVSAGESSPECVLCLAGRCRKPSLPLPGLLGKWITLCRSLLLAAVTSDDLRSHHLFPTGPCTLQSHSHSKALSIYCRAVWFNCIFNVYTLVFFSLPEFIFAMQHRHLITLNPILKKWIYFKIYPFSKPPWEQAIRLYKFVLVCFAMLVLSSFFLGGVLAMLSVNVIKPVITLSIKHRVSCHVGCCNSSNTLVLVFYIFAFRFSSVLTLHPASSAATLHTILLVTNVMNLTQRAHTNSNCPLIF